MHTYSMHTTIAKFGPMIRIMDFSVIHSIMVVFLDPLESESHLTSVPTYGLGLRDFRVQGSP